MSLKNTLIVTTNLNNHIQRIKSEKHENIDKLQEIEAYEAEKISVLNETLDAFENLLEIIDNDVAESKTWRRTINHARSYLGEIK